MVNIWKIGSSPGLEDTKRADYLGISKKYGFVAIGWKYLGDLSNQTEEEIKSRLRRNGQSDRSSSQIYDFCRVIDKGDIILHYKGQGIIFCVGKVREQKPYYFVSENEDKTELKGVAPHRINVDWLFNGNSFEGSITDNITVKKLDEKDLSSIEKKLRDFLHSILNATSEKNRAKEAIPALHLNKKQIILYGPPGTGKTYNSRKKAVEIIMEVGD